MNKAEFKSKVKKMSADLDKNLWHSVMWILTPPIVGWLLLEKYAGKIPDTNLSLYIFGGLAILYLVSLIYLIYHNAKKIRLKHNLACVSCGYTLWHEKQITFVRYYEKCLNCKSKFYDD